MISPRILSVDRAAREIATTVLSEPQAFFFLTGAGVSYPQIPLAAGIIEECRQRVPSAEPQGLTPMERYSWWLREAFPSNASRQRYIRELIRGKNVSQGNLRLAHLLLSRKVTNLVVTPNFDDFLARALVLFGEQPVVCDHPETIIKINDAAEADLQVVHLHGTYSFYDCKNLAYQVEHAAARHEESPYSMRGFLDSLLLRRSPLVTGYSGWEKDVFMTALRSRLQRSLKYNVYWFCYRQADLDTLPSWLREHEDVYFVLPARAAGELPATQELSATSNDPDRASLPVREVFDTLLREFRIDDPPLLADPFAFYRDYFDRLAPRDELGQVDIYFRDVIQVFQQVRDAGTAPGAVLRREDPLAELRLTLRAAQYPAAVRLARGLRLEELDGSQLRDVMSSMQDAANGLRDDSDEEVEAYRLVGECAKLVSNDDPAPWLAQRWAKALLFRSMAHESRNEPEQGIAACEEIIQRFGDSKEPGLKEWIAKALGSKGHNLDVLKRPEDAVEAFDELITRFRDDPDEEVAGPVAWALIDKSRNLVTLGKPQEALATLSEAIARASAEGGPDLSPQLGWALSETARVLESLGQIDPAIAIFDDIVSRFSHSTDARMLRHTAAALVDKGRSLARQKRDEQALPVFDEAISRFGASSDSAIQVQVAWALISKGHSLEVLSRVEEALAAYEEVAQRFGKSQDARVRERVAWAMTDKGFALELADRYQEAIPIYDEVIARFSEKSDRRIDESVAGAMFRKGWSLASLNRHAEAVAVYDELEARFGGETFPPLRARVASAAAGKGRSLWKMGRAEEAIALYDDVTQRFGGDSSPLVLRQVAKALVAKALALEESRPEESMAAYGEVFRRYSQSSDPELQEQVARALVNAGELLRVSNRLEEAATHWKEALTRYGQSTDEGVQREVARAQEWLNENAAAPPPKKQSRSPKAKAAAAQSRGPGRSRHTK